MESARQRLLDLRARLFRDIDTYFEDSDGHCKSYEGTFRIVEHFPDYFDDSRMDMTTFSVELDLYVIGPNRHYNWDAPTLDKAVEKCVSEVSEWLDDFESDER